MPKVSVIIPAYNSLHYLPSALESVRKQTFTDYEIIIVDDGSTDDTKEWGTNLNISNVAFFSQPNQGSAAARNTGLSHASGEYIAFLDADDVWAETKLEKQVNALETSPEVGLVYGWVGSIDASSQQHGKIRKNNFEGNVWQRISRKDIIECGSIPMVRRACFKKVGLFDTSLSYAQVWDMWIRIAAEYPFKVIHEVLTYYRAHPGNHSKNWTRMEPNYQRIINKNFPESSPELLNIRNTAYAFAYLRIAWKILQSQKHVSKEVRQYASKSFKASPKILFSDEYIRLNLAMTMINLFGFDGYGSFRQTIHKFKRAISK